MRNPTWSLKTKTLKLGRRPLLMGIVNVTPDSFSDGGKFADPHIAIDHAMQLVRDGADILDIGGESTRPYSEPVDPEQEAARVVPVIENLAQLTDVPISIDTSKASVAQAALAAGAEIINDVTGLTGDQEMLSVALESQAGICAMHMQGNPQNMQDDPSYVDVVAEIFEYLNARRQCLLEAGVAEEKICLDPGIGFGKTHEHNLELIDRCEEFLSLGRPILVGHSRKGFIGKLIGDKEADRDPGTLAITLLLAQKGIHIIRVHEIRNTSLALTAFEGASGLKKLPENQAT